MTTIVDAALKHCDNSTEIDVDEDIRLRNLIRKNFALVSYLFIILSYL